MNGAIFVSPSFQVVCYGLSTRESVSEVEGPVLSRNLNRFNFQEICGWRQLNILFTYYVFKSQLFWCSNDNFTKEISIEIFDTVTQYSLAGSEFMKKFSLYQTELYLYLHQGGSHSNRSFPPPRGQLLLPGNSLAPMHLERHPVNVMHCGGILPILATREGQHFAEVLWLMNLSRAKLSTFPGCTYYASFASAR